MFLHNPGTEVVVWILLYVQLSYFLGRYLAEFVDVLLVLAEMKGSPH